jgi:import inner membrane translocase subunit TIM44
MNRTQTAQGMVSDSRILDIRKVELLSAKILDNDMPILLIEFNTQEILMFRNRKSGEVVLGSEDNIEHARYRMVWTRDQCVDPTIAVNARTFGWRVVESVKVDSWSGF